MPQKDFILREIEKMAIFLRIIIDKLLGRQPSADLIRELQSIDSIFLDNCGFDTSFLSDAKADELISALEKQQGFNSANIEELGDFMVLLADSLSTADAEKSKKLKINALALYEYINQKDKTFSMERNDKIEEIRRTLN